ncbi:MAG: nucleoside hydrolase [Chloroflexota bacterium]|nr:nucleoside hydrolase [Chloroflexota bacterium]MBI5702508.1 nucleoside hydrolase [Chloroflexota bacterium]
MPKRILIDTDPGIDDALAILLALASPELSLEGLSVVHGNCSLEQAVRNGLSILELAGATHIPLARGCELPLVQPSLLAPETHGNTGLGYAKLPEPRIQPIGQHGSDFLIEKVLSNPGEITLVAIGPLTNVALAIRKEPKFAKALKEIIIMGGAIRHEGNTTALAEFNTYVDPHAAHIVFHAGIPATLVPLDVTYQCALMASDVERLLKIKSPITKFIKEATDFYMEYHDAWQGIQGCIINDPLALALTFAPELCDYQNLPVDVDISGGVSMGKTFADFYNYQKKPANMRVALGVRARDFIELFLERMERLSNSLPNRLPKS